MRQIKNLGLSILFLLLISCETEVKLTDYLNTDKPLSLTKKTADINDKETIEPNSDKYRQLLKWGENNLTDWKSTPASYFVEVAVHQDNFHLLYLKDGFVVVSFADKEGKSQQFQKKIKPGELDFLLK